jgi:hypothetical protein
MIDTQVLNEQEVKRIAGGVSQSEYCATMSMIYDSGKYKNFWIQ